MKSGIKIVKFSEKIEAQGWKITCSHGEAGDTLTADGYQDWQQTLGSPMGGWGMFRECGFLGPMDDLFLFVQIYEHSRGGHTDAFFHLFDRSGEALWQFHGPRHQINAVCVNDHQIFFLQEDRNGIQPPPHYSGTNLEIRDLRSGKISRVIPLALPEKMVPESIQSKAFQDRFGLFMGQVQFMEKRNEIYLHFDPGKFARDNWAVSATGKVSLRDLL